MTTGKSEPLRWLLLLALLFCGCAHAGAGKRELVFLTWENYLDPGLVQEFEQQTNCTVRFVYFDDDDERNMILANTQATGFDLVLVDHTMVETYRQHNWLQPMTLNQVPNARHARDPWYREKQEEPFYSVSYLWGGLGIVYRTDLMQSPPEHWRDMFQPAPYLKNHILLLNTVQTTYGLALMALGFPFNSTDPAHIQQATTLLNNVRPFVAEFRNIRLGQDSELIKGDIYAAITYNGDAMMLMKHSDKLAFVYPTEGVPLWLDMIAVLKSSRRPKLAMQFLNFINIPANAARNSLYLKYATTNVAALPLLPEDFTKDSRVFPDNSATSRNQLYEQLPTDHLRRITSQLVQIMAQ